MAFSMMSVCLCNLSVSAADANSNPNNLGKTTEYHLEYNGKKFQGFIFKPENEGKYPVVVLIAGTGGAGKFGKNFEGTMNKWLNKEFIEPKIYIMPAFSSDVNAGFKGDQYKIFLEYDLRYMKDAFLASEYGKYMDVSKPMSVAGYSMGGSAAMYAGNLYPNTYVNVGGLSPGQEYYSTNEGYGWIKSSNVVFSKNSRARRLLACSKKEGDYYNKAVSDYDTLTRSKGYRFKIYRTNEGKHEWNIFIREIFIFLYYIDHNIVLTDQRLSSIGYVK